MVDLWFTFCATCNCWNVASEEMLWQIQHAEKCHHVFPAFCVGFVYESVCLSTWKKVTTVFFGVCDASKLRKCLSGDLWGRTQKFLTPESRNFFAPRENQKCQFWGVTQLGMTFELPKVGNGPQNLQQKVANQKETPERVQNHLQRSEKE